MNSINKINVDIQPKQLVSAAQPKGQSFDEILKSEVSKNEEVKFSKHALERLKDRQIYLSDNDRSLISDAVNKVAAKGSKESLLLLNDMALLVSVKNRTVITAVDNHVDEDKVFTNIDSAMIVK